MYELILVVYTMTANPARADTLYATAPATTLVATFNDRQACEGVRDSGNEEIDHVRKDRRAEELKGTLMCIKRR